MISLLRPEVYRSSSLEKWLRDYLTYEDPFFAGRAGRGPTLAADVYEDADTFHALMELPGVAKENLDVTLENSVLRISGKYTAKPGEENNASEFSRALAIPDGVDATGVRAELRDGILHLRLPKHEARKPRTIEIG